MLPTVLQAVISPVYILSAAHERSVSVCGVERKEACHVVYVGWSLWNFVKFTTKKGSLPSRSTCVCASLEGLAKG